MASRNIEAVRALIPGSEVDITEILRDDEVYARFAAAFEELIDPEFECSAVWQEGKTYAGIYGFREMWRDWVEPWATYYVAVEELIDLGDRIVTLVRDRARRHDTEHEVELVSGSIWDFRDGRLLRAQFLRDRDETLRAAGLDE
jgi:hypothetical protein